MTDYERYQQFYQQFNTVVHNHQEWLRSPEGTLAVLKDPWKAQPPIVNIDHPHNENKARDILTMLRQRHSKNAASAPLLSQEAQQNLSTQAGANNAHNNL